MARDGAARALLTAKVLAAATSSAAALVLGLDQLGAFEPDPGLRTAAVVAAAVLAFGATAGAALREFRAPEVDARRDDVRLLLQGLALTVFDLTDIDVRDLGLAVYLVRRERLLPWRRRLVRVHRERAARRPSASDVVWRPGKGVIGRCVQSGADEAQDVGADGAAWTRATQDDWDLRVPDAVRAGLTLEEFRRLAGRYSVVVATPLLDDRGTTTRVIGCLALDGPEGSFEDLSADDVRAAMAEVASTVRRVLTSA